MITLWISSLALLASPYSFKVVNDATIYNEVEQDSFSYQYDTEGHELFISDLGEYTARDYEYLEFHHDFGSGDVSFQLIPNKTTYVSDGVTYTTYSFQFKAVDEPVLTNIYLYNVQVYFPSTGAYTAKTIYIPNIYFRGTPFYSDSLDGDQYFFEAANFGANRGFEFHYSVGSLPMNIANTDGSYQNGYNDGWNDGYDYAYEDGYSDGYNNGYMDAEDFIDGSSATATVIFTGIIDVALLPINFFLACLNFEVFGINIGGFVTATLTVMIVIIIFRVIFSGGTSSKSE